MRKSVRKNLFINKYQLSNYKHSTVIKKNMPTVVGKQ